MSELIECECCDYKGTDVKKVYGNMLMCPACLKKEEELEKQTEETAQDRVDAMNDVLKRQREIDTSINISTDLFNARTVAIVEMKAAIDQDNTIENKEFELASRLKERFTHLKQVVFDIDKQRLEATTEQRSIQQYLNELANRLRTEEREQLRLSDISYQPKPPKVVSDKPRKKRGPKKPTFDKAELKRVAGEMGIPEFTLQMTCVSKNCTPTEAADFIKELQAKTS